MLHGEAIIYISSLQNKLWLLFKTVKRDQVVELYTRENTKSQYSIKEKLKKISFITTVFRQFLVVF